jgi:hypothetical protein
MESSPVVDMKGWYHFEVASVTCDLGVTNQQGNVQSPHVLVKCTVVHTVPGQSPAGRTLYHRLTVGGRGGGPPSDGAKKATLRFLEGCGVVRWGNVDGQPSLVDSETGSDDLDVATFERLRGRHFIAYIDEQPSNDPKYGPRFAIPYGRSYSMTDERVADKPRNVALYQQSQAGGTSGSTIGARPTPSVSSVPDDF